MNSNDIARPRAFAIALAGSPMAPSSLPLCDTAAPLPPPPPCGIHSFHSSRLSWLMNVRL
jgi:hypothetical protein